jgi:alpha-L-rhamnosidase
MNSPTSNLKPAALTCEHLHNPLGLTEPKPRLSWTLETDQRNQRQTAYQILVAERPEDLENNRGTLWDSGRVPSDQMVDVVYTGRPLRSRQRCLWKVRVWDAGNAASDYSEPAMWQMGLFNGDDWQAEWIGIETETTTDLKLKPGVFLRKPFTLDAPVTRATLYATAKGVYRPYLNGKRVGRAELAPGWTDYHRRIQVQTYDVTDQIQEGENALGLLLGEGWYSGYLGFKGIHNYYGDQPAVLSQLEIVYEDGTTDLIATDETWRAAVGPVRHSDIQMGERYDARLAMPGWDEPGFDDEKWRPVQTQPRDPDVALVNPPGPPMRVTREITPVDVTEQTPGVYIFDMGQNMVGWVTLHLDGADAEPGTEIRLRYGEVLEPDGSLHTANLRSARATDEYVTSGEGDETFEPHFTYHGFRYVEVTGYPGTPSLETLTGRVVHNDLSHTGDFECSHAMVNQLWKNILWGQRGNFVSIPTDCPQRDERLGWTGDAQIFCRTASFNMDVLPFFTKWLDDLVDAQTPDGAYPDVAPQIKGMNKGAPAWGDAGIIIPWTLYRVYGDTRLIETHYESMQAWMAYVQEVNPLYLRTKRLNNNYSDWVALERGSSAEQIATAYWVKLARMMAEMAEAVGRTLDAQRYGALAETIRQAYLTAYVQPDGEIETHTQTAYVMALDNDLLPENLQRAAADNLVAAIDRHGGHLATGFLGTPPLCFVLAEHGHLDVAYQLLTQETYPSWGYMIKNGATTMWERWNAYTEETGIHDPGMNSFNHYAYGSIGEWLYRVVAGINAGAPGYREIALRPRPGGGLTYAEASYRSSRGLIRSGWHQEDDGMRYDVTVPANTTATLEIPTDDPSSVREGELPADEAVGVRFIKYENGFAVYHLGSGTYRFTAPSRTG